MAEQQIFRDIGHIWDLKTLAKPPATYPAHDELRPVGYRSLSYQGVVYTPELRAKDMTNNAVKSIFYDGPVFKGKPTRVFAYLGIPVVPDTEKLPAMVLVHGGDGTAFESWVRLWNARGYAAIAMDTCGCVPVSSCNEWKRHDSGGPAGWGGFDQIDWPVQDQWIYQAVSDIILANSLLRSFPEINPDCIGITGVSWGGILTCIAAGIDSRFRFAAMIYGCGFLGKSPEWWGPRFDKIGKEKTKQWLDLWDPSKYVQEIRMPTLWLNGTNDPAFSLDSWQKTHCLVQGTKVVSLRVNMAHGHGGPSETPEEIHVFANGCCKDRKPMARIKGLRRSGNKIWATCSSQLPIIRAELIYTKDTCNWPTRKWETAAASINKVASENYRVSAILHQDTKLYFINFIDNRGVIVSTNCSGQLAR